MLHNRNDYSYLTISLDFDLMSSRLLFCFRVYFILGAEDIHVILRLEGIHPQWMFVF